MINKFFHFLLWVNLVVIVIGVGYAFASSRAFRNPGLMSMHRREFIAAGIAQGMAANGETHVYAPDIFADRVLQYTDAIMRALDKEDN
jgi:hypothetical protein